jgi:G3E family GTPase
MISTKGNVAAKIYLLVGFFGSGKTTFIRKLLNNQKN